MARIRTIKPEFYSNESLSELPEVVHLAAGGLLTYADDYGYFNANPGLIKAALFPLREPSVSVPEILRSLQNIGYIRLGKGKDGKTFGQVVKFDDHQRVSHPTASKIKELVTEWFDSRAIPESSGEIPSGKEQGREGKGTGNGVAPAAPDAPTNPVWFSYAQAYEARYQVPPKRNAKVNGLLKNLLSRLGADEAPEVAAFYVGHPSAYYVQRGHALDCLLADAEKLRTEWATNRTITGNQARQQERTADNPFARFVGQNQKAIAHEGK